MKPLAYYATIQHAQWMLATDGYYFDLIREGKGQDRLRATLAMFRDYRVSRTIWAEDGPTKLALSVLDDKRPWPVSFGDRVARCADLAEAADRPSGENGTIQGVPYSAVSKLCWFLHPEGWTMFDQYARLGLTGPMAMSKGKEKFTGFYEGLQIAKFAEMTTKLNDLIKRQSLRGLHGERIIDKFLMLRGNIWSRSPIGATVWRQQTQDQLDHFLTNLERVNKEGKGLGRTLRESADAVAEVLPNGGLETSYTKKKLETRPLS